LQRITYALGQIMTRGKVMSTEMLQLTNAGIPAWAILANGMGKSTGEMQKMVEKGLVPASTAIPILLKGIEQGTDGVAGKTVAFAGMMEQQYNTLSGIWARTKEAFTISMGKMVEPAIPLLKSGLVQIQSLFQGIPDMMARLKTAMQPVFDFITGPFYTSEPAVTPIIKLVGVGLVEAWKLATAGLKWFGDILVAVTGWLKDHQLIVYTVVGAVTAYVTVITALNTIYMTVRLAMLAFAAVQAIVNAVMAANPITLVVVALGALAGAFIYAYTHSETFRNFVNNGRGLAGDQGRRRQGLGGHQGQRLRPARQFRQREPHPDLEYVPGQRGPQLERDQGWDLVGVGGHQGRGLPAAGGFCQQHADANLAAVPG
jgi:tape measure domain-containing protein